MGREVKRVPLDFEWPEGQIWKGYWNPYSGMPCKTCDESGHSPEYRELLDRWYDRHVGWQDNLSQEEFDALKRAGRVRDFESVAQLNEYRGFLKHDSINSWVVIRFHLKREGKPEGCGFCNGEGQHWPESKYRDLAENWERIEPPEGDGYQVWETVSEGSPVSPVFATTEELADYMAESETGVHMTTRENWLKWINGPGWAVSMMVGPDGVKGGVEASVSEGAA